MTGPTPGGWNPCPQGELTRLAAHLTFRRRLRAAAAAGLVLLAGAGLAGAGWLAHSALSGPPASGGPECCPASTTDGCDGHTATPAPPGETKPGNPK